MAEQSKPKQVMDVSKPGQTAAGASSRPIIVSDRPSVQDPMVSTPTAPPLDEETAEKIPVTKTPSQKQTPPPKQQPKPQPSQPSAPAEPEQKQTPEKQEPQAPPQEPAPPKEQTQPEPQPKAESDRPYPREELVHDRTYFMPVTKPPRRHGFPWLLVLLIIILIGVAVYIALDAEIIPNNLPLNLID